MKYLLLVLILFSFSFTEIMQIDSTLIKDSTKALKWARLPVASLGQVYNKKYLKSLIFIAGQSYSLERVYHYNKFNDIENIKKRNQNAWWFLGIYIASIIDSYIDAELSSFPERKN